MEKQELKIENLQSGMMLKNYKELCEVLGVKPKTGNTKIAQLKEFERHFSYTKQGHKIIINEVFNMAKDKIENRGTKGKYTNDIQDLIISILAQSDSEEIALSTNVLLKKCNMVNQNFSLGRKNVPKLSELTNISEAEIYDYYDTTQTNLKGALETALNRLRRRAVAMWKKDIYVAKVEADEEGYNMLGEIKLNVGDSFKDKVSVKVKQVHRQATKEEKAIILDTEKHVMQQMKCKDLQEVFLKGKWNEFKKIALHIIKHEFNLNILYYYDCYVLNYSNKVIKAEMKDIKDKINVTSKNLNDKVKKAIVESAETKHNNAVNKIEEFEYRLSTKEPNSKDKLRATKNYIANVKIFRDTVIDTNAKDLQEELKQKVNKVNKADNNEETNNSEMPF